MRNNKTWAIDKDLFKIASTNSPELMRKSLLLLYKIYNLQKIVYKTYEEGEKEKRSSLRLRDIFSLLDKNNLEVNTLIQINMLKLANT